MRLCFSMHPAPLILISLLLAGCASSRRERVAPPDPTRFEEAIAAYETLDREAMPPAGAVVCVGSSSIVGWQERIACDLAPLTIVSRGFGGSTMGELLHYVDRIVIAYRPRAVVIYEGDNDMALRQPPRRVLRDLRRIVGRIHEHLPGTRVYVLAVKPSESRWALWPQTKKLNRLLRRECRRRRRLIYVDVATPLLGADGRPDPRYFLEDKLHLNAAGYDLWRDTLAPVLMKREAEFEAVSTKLREEPEQ